MPITNCKHCGRIFNKVRRDICPACAEAEEKAFQTVKAYLRAHKDASMIEVNEATGVDVEVIIEMIQDGKLMLRDNPNLSYGCERCGNPTQAGRYCAKCTQELSHALSGAAEDLRHKSERQANSGQGFFSK